MTPQAGNGNASAADIGADQPIPILVTLAAEEGEALAAAMERAMETAGEARAAMVEEAYTRVRTMCSTPIVLDKWETLFDRLLERRAA